jgi:hypothetical protein
MTSIERRLEKVEAQAAIFHSNHLGWTLKAWRRWRSGEPVDVEDPDIAEAIEAAEDRRQEALETMEVYGDGIE